MTDEDGKRILFHDGGGEPVTAHIDPGGGGAILMIECPGGMWFLRKHAAQGAEDALRIAEVLRHFAETGELLE